MNPRDLGTAIKIARAAGLIWEVKTSLYSTTIIVEQPLESSLGTTVVSLGRSHRKERELRRAIPETEWLYASSNYGTHYYRIPNTAEAVNAACKIGARILKKQLSSYTPNTVFQYSFVTKKQQERRAEHDEWIAVQLKLARGE